jgi:predicted nucleotidyltransferase
MRTGVIEANLVTLNEAAKLPFLGELIQRKIAGAEKERLTETDLGFHHREYERLRANLEEAYQSSTLPDGPRATDALHDLLVRLRLK